MAIRPQEVQFWAAPYAGQQQQQPRQQQMPIPLHAMKSVFVVQDIRQMSAQQARQFQVRPMHGAQPMQPPQAMQTAPTMWQPAPTHATAAAHCPYRHPPPPPGVLAPGAAPATLSPVGAATASQASPTVGAKEVLAAVESLYTDNLRPYGRIVRKRLGELSDAAGQGEVEIDAKRLRSLCEGCVQLTVQNEEGGDWSTLLAGRSDNFVDVYSPQDIYPTELWDEASKYFSSLGDDQMALPGGRYSCAQVLMGRDLGFLSGRSLGEVCHIVQLAISQKKLLGYLNGAVVPYYRSQSMIKERCAERQRPCAGAPARGGHAGVANWDMVRAFLEDAMGSTSPNSGFIPLSNIKRLFRSKLRAELSETALGYAKLSELLQDPRLRDLCSVRLQGHGYAVFPKATSSTAAARPAASERSNPRSATWSPEKDTGPREAAAPGSEAVQKGEGAKQPGRLPALLYSAPATCPKAGAEGAGAPRPGRARPRPCALTVDTNPVDGLSTGTTSTPTLDAADAEHLVTPSGEANLWTKPLLTPESNRSRRKRSKSLPRNLGSDA